MRLWLAGAIFLITGSLIFGPSLENPFVFDDEEQVVNNAHIEKFDLKTLFSSSSFNAGGAHKMGGNYYKPIMTSYYATIFHFFGLNPVAYRLPMLLLHILSALLIFIIFKSLFSAWATFTLAYLFLIHPVNAEVVLYIADAQDVLYMFFGLCSLLAIKKLNGPTMILACSFSLCLSLLSKETGALFLPISMAYSFFFYREKFKSVIWTTFALGVGYLSLRWALGLTRTISPQLLLHHATLQERLMTVPSALFHYIEIFFVPIRLSLTTDYVVRTLNFKDFWLPLIGLSIFALLIFKLNRSLQTKSQQTHFKFFLTIVALWLILHGQIFVPLDGVYADRWFYLGVLSFVGLLVVWCESKKLFASKGLQVALIFIFLGLGIRNYIRGLDWTSGLALYKAELSVHPKDPLMNNNYGVELFRAGRFEEAKMYIERSVAENPHWPTSWNNLGALQERFDLFDDALKSYENSLAKGDYQLTYENYPKLLFKLNQNDKALKFINEEALPRYPKSPTLNELRETLSRLSTQHQ